MKTMSLNILTKIMRQKEGELGKCWQGWKRGGGGLGNADNGWQRGERNLDPTCLADIICEQPLTQADQCSLYQPLYQFEHSWMMLHCTPLLTQFVLFVPFLRKLSRSKVLGPKNDNLAASEPPECIHSQPSSLPQSPSDKVKPLLWVTKETFGRLKSLPYTAVKSWRWSKKVAQSWSLGVAKDGGVYQWMSDVWPVEDFMDITRLQLLLFMLCGYIQSCCQH